MKIIIKIVRCLSAVLLALSSQALANCYDLQHGSLLGHMQYVRIKKGDTFVSLAQRYGVGYNQIQAANPGLDAKKPLINALVVIPSQVIVPDVPHRGIVINLSQMRLFYFLPKLHRVCTYPVGIGQVNWATPQGKLFIMQKIKNPVWIVPDTILAYRKKNGDPIHKVMPSGPDNPLGYFALRLSRPTYLIHGTNDPGSIGRRSSAGCIHLFANDIQELFSMVHLKTPVRIIDQPFLFAKSNGHTWFSSFPLLQEFKEKWGAKAQSRILEDRFLRMVGKGNAQMFALVKKEVRASTGVPIPL